MKIINNLSIAIFIFSFWVTNNKMDAQCATGTCNPQLVSAGFTPGSCVSLNGTREYELGWFMNSTGVICSAPPGSLRIQISLPLNGIYGSSLGISDVSELPSSRFTWDYNSTNRTFNGVNNVVINQYDAGSIKINVTGLTGNNCASESSQANLFIIPNLPPFFNGCPQAFENISVDDAQTASLGVMSPLPIELKDFSAKNSKCGEVLLDWETSHEHNSDYVAIERSVDGVNFEEIGKISSQNTSYGASYVYPDNNVSESKRYYYKLNQVDFDGRSHIHKVVSILTSSCSGGEVNIQLQPNPVFDRLNVVFNGFTENNRLELIITNVIGEIVMKVPDAVTNDVNMISVNNLSPGIYNIKAVGYENILSKRFIKVE